MDDLNITSTAGLDRSTEKFDDGDVFTFDDFNSDFDDTPNTAFTRTLPADWFELVP